jgi:bacterial/archaeal transporter family protein
MDYRVWALLSALFAGLTAILAKKGVEDVSSNLALAIRVLVVAVAAWLIVLARSEAKMSTIQPKTWLFLTLSGLATGASWLCYFRALKGGPVSKVAPIDKLSFVIAVVLGFVFLREKVSVNVLAGCVLIVAGVAVTLT